MMIIKTAVAFLLLAVFTLEVTGQRIKGYTKRGSSEVTAEIVESKGKEKVPKICFHKEKASTEVKRWAKDVLRKQSQNYDAPFFDVLLSVVENSDGVLWVIVSDGLQGAFYFENLDKEHQIGRYGAYLYPDYSTAVVGVWKDHLLVSGRFTQLEKACMSENMWTLQFGELEGPIMSYSPPKHYSYGVHPLQRDPYEQRTIEVQTSVLLGANHGLFTKRDVEKGDILAFYGGYMVSCWSSLRALDRQKYSDAEEEKIDMYSVALGLDYDYCLDLPHHLGSDLSKYNATLGHKLNHSFEPNTEFFLFSVHPILGTIMSLSALEDIPEGTELTVNYGYEKSPEQPEWFTKQWINYYGDIVKEEGKKEDEKTEDQKPIEEEHHVEL